MRCSFLRQLSCFRRFTPSWHVGQSPFKAKSHNSFWTRTVLVPEKQLSLKTWHGTCWPWPHQTFVACMIGIGHLPWSANATRLSEWKLSAGWSQPHCMTSVRRSISSCRETHNTQGLAKCLPQFPALPLLKMPTACHLFSCTPNQNPAKRLSRQLHSHFSPDWDQNWKYHPAVLLWNGTAEVWSRTQTQETRPGCVHTTPDRTWLALFADVLGARCKRTSLFSSVQRSFFSSNKPHLCLTQVRFLWFQAEPLGKQTNGQIYWIHVTELAGGLRLGSRTRHQAFSLISCSCTWAHSVIVQNTPFSSSSAPSDAQTCMRRMMTKPQKVLTAPCSFGFHQIVQEMPHPAVNNLFSVSFTACINSNLPPKRKLKFFGTELQQRKLRDPPFLPFENWNPDWAERQETTATKSTTFFLSFRTSHTNESNKKPIFFQNTYFLQSVVRCRL